MKILTTVSALLAILLIAGGCVSVRKTGAPVPVTGSSLPSNVPVFPPPGLIYTGVKAPLTLDPPHAANPGKMGSSYSSYVRIPIIGLDFSWGDASINGAASQGGISKVAYADYEMFQILGIFGRMTVHAYGD